jgi:phage terminase large subunit-like protein
MTELIEIRPNAGPQEAFLSCPADIALYGGAAGGGKTFAILLDVLRGVDDPHFRAVVFRRTTKNLRNEGGIWEDAVEFFAPFGGMPRESPQLQIRFPSGASITFTHLQHEKNKLDHKGGQYTAIYFDELTEFTDSQFWYLYSRNRSPLSRFEPWMRATTNPMPGWVADLIAWWIDQDTGYPIPERSGVVRWFVRDGDAIKWVGEDYRDEDGDRPTSLTFIRSTLDDNPHLGSTYRKKLKTQDFVERKRLLEGNWLATRQGDFFKHHRIGLYTCKPSELPEAQSVRYWDLADSEPTEKRPDPDDTASAKGRMTSTADADGVICRTLYLEDMTFDELQGDAKRVKMRRVAKADGAHIPIAIEQEPGGSGKELAHDYRNKYLAGYAVILDIPKGSKTVRAQRWLPIAEGGEAGRVVIVTDEDGNMPPWFDQLVAQLAAFPGKPRDGIDAISGLYNILTGKMPRRRRLKFTRA